MILYLQAEYDSANFNIEDYENECYVAPEVGFSIDGDNVCIRARNPAREIHISLEEFNKFVNVIKNKK